jgi:hypothetical protein
MIRYKRVVHVSLIGREREREKESRGGERNKERKKKKERKREKWFCSRSVLVT